MHQQGAPQTHTTNPPLKRVKWVVRHSCCTSILSGVFLYLVTSGHNLQACRRGGSGLGLCLLLRFALRCAARIRHSGLGTRAHAHSLHRLVHGDGANVLQRLHVPQVDHAVAPPAHQRSAYMLNVSCVRVVCRCFSFLYASLGAIVFFLFRECVSAQDERVSRAR